MDSLVLEVAEDTDSIWGDEVVFIVNGQDLRDLVTRSGQDWIGPPTKLLRTFPDQLRGGPDRWEDPIYPWYDQAALLACECGQPGCDAVLARITMTRTSVTWELTDRTGEPLSIGPFRFARTAYESSVGVLVRRIP